MAEQERMHGDVLRIRPLPLVFFAWLTTAAVAGTLIYLLLVLGKK